MQTRLSRGEYWLLETVVEVACPLAFLDASGYGKRSRSLESPSERVAFLPKPFGRDELLRKVRETLDAEP